MFRKGQMPIADHQCHWQTKGQRLTDDQMFHKVHIFYHEHRHIYGNVPFCCVILSKLVQSFILAVKCFISMLSARIQDHWRMKSVFIFVPTVWSFSNQNLTILVCSNSIYLSTNNECPNMSGLVGLKICLHINYNPRKD